MVKERVYNHGSRQWQPADQWECFMTCEGTNESVGWAATVTLSVTDITGQQQYQQCVACTTPPLHTLTSRFQTTPTDTIPLQRTWINIAVSFTEVSQWVQRTWQPETWTLLPYCMYLLYLWCWILFLVLDQLSSTEYACVCNWDTGWMEMTLNTNVTIQWFWK